jgi:hypothetical protein
MEDEEKEEEGEKEDEFPEKGVEKKPGSLGHEDDHLDEDFSDFESEPSPHEKEDEDSLDRLIDEEMEEGEEEDNYNNEDYE